MNVKWMSREVFRTRRWYVKWISKTSTYFGALAVIDAVVLASFTTPRNAGFIRNLYSLSALSCTLVAFVAVLPKHYIERHIRDHDVVLTVKIGDIFQDPGTLVVSFADTFDTDITDNEIIHESSLQGQLIEREFSGVVADLDRQIDQYIAGAQLAGEERLSKHRGKRTVYPIGTTLRLSGNSHQFYAVALTKMSDELIVESSPDYLWQSLQSVWQQHRIAGNMGPLTLPLLGTELARISGLTPERVITLILVSFVTAQSIKPITKHLTIVVHHRQAAALDWLALEDLIRALL